MKKLVLFTLISLLACAGSALALALIAVGANPPVVAADDLAPPPQMQSARDLFNDQPKGLSDHVVAWKLIYIGETFANLWGGLEQGAIYEGIRRYGRKTMAGQLSGRHPALLPECVQP
jgi:hypothetical protein